MSFEDKFTEQQTNMIALALEYAEALNQSIEAVYIYASKEQNMSDFDVFFRTVQGYFKKHKLSDKPEINLQRQLIDIGLNDWMAIEELCQQYEKPMPTQLKLIYETATKRVKATYSYDLLYSTSDALLSDDIFNQWFEEVSQETIEQPKEPDQKKGLLSRWFSKKKP